MPNYINQNLNDQYLSVDKDIITNNNGSFQKANNGNYFQNTNYINNANRNLRDQNQPQLQLESDLLNTSESNYFPNYDSKMNSNFPNSFTKSMFINNNESTPINNVSLSNETSLIYTNPQNQFVNQERFVDTSNVSGNRQNFNPMSMPLPSIRNTAYQEIPLNPKLNQVMLNEPQSRNQAMKTFSNNFSTNIIPTHKQTLDSSPYLTTNNVPKITDLPRNQSGKKQKRTFSSKKKTNIHDLRNFLRESNTKVISSPDQEENNRHSYLYPTQTQSNSLSEELHINHF